MFLRSTKILLKSESGLFIVRTFLFVFFSPLRNPTGTGPPGTPTGTGPQDQADDRKPGDSQYMPGGTRTPTDHCRGARTRTSGDHCGAARTRTPGDHCRAGGTRTSAHQRR